MSNARENAGTQSFCHVIKIGPPVCSLLALLPGISKNYCEPVCSYFRLVHVVMSASDLRWVLSDEIPSWTKHYRIVGNKTVTLLKVGQWPCWKTLPTSYTMANISACIPISSLDQPCWSMWSPDWDAITHNNTHEYTMTTSHTHKGSGSQTSSYQLR